MSLIIEKICAFCGKPPRKDEAGNDIKMKTCSRCKIVFYHDVECQKKHWKVHKKTCGKPAAPKAAPKPARPKQTHRSADTIHQRVTRRFKELRKEGVPVQEAMQRARMEFQPPDNMDAGSKDDSASSKEISIDFGEFDEGQQITHTRNKKTSARSTVDQYNRVWDRWILRKT